MNNREAEPFFKGRLRKTLPITVIDSTTPKISSTSLRVSTKSSCERVVVKATKQTQQQQHSNAPLTDSILFENSACETRKKRERESEETRIRIKSILYQSIYQSQLITNKQTRRFVTREKDRQIQKETSRHTQRGVEEREEKRRKGEKERSRQEERKRDRAGRGNEREWMDGDKSAEAAAAEL